MFPKRFRNVSVSGTTETVHRNEILFLALSIFFSSPLSLSLKKISVFYLSFSLSPSKTSSLSLKHKPSTPQREKTRIYQDPRDKPKLHEARRWGGGGGGSGSGGMKVLNFTGFQRFLLEWSGSGSRSGDGGGGGGGGGDRDHF